LILATIFILSTSQISIPTVQEWIFLVLFSLLPLAATLLIICDRAGQNRSFTGCRIRLMQYTVLLHISVLQRATMSHVELIVNITCGICHLLYIKLRRIIGQYVGPEC